jgi:hypothetical protein
LSLKGGETAVGMTVTGQHILTDTSNTACTLHGTPHLAFLHADGRPVAGLTAQAAPSGDRPTRVTVQPGEHASFEITTGSCAYDPHINPNMATTTVITIPGESKAFTYLSRFSLQCSEQRSFVSSIVTGVRPIPNVVVVQPKRDRGSAPNAPVGSLIVRFINDSAVTWKLHAWATLIAETAPPGSTHADAKDWPGTDLADVSQVGVPTVILKPDERADAIFEAADGSPSGAPCGPAYRTLRVKPPRAAAPAWAANRRTHVLLDPRERGLAFTQQCPPLGSRQFHHRLHCIDPQVVILAHLSDRVARTRRLDQPKDEDLIPELVMQTAKPARAGRPLKPPLAIAGRDPDLCHGITVLTVLASELSCPLEHRLNLRPTGHGARAVRILPALH